MAQEHTHGSAKPTVGIVVEINKQKCEVDH